MLAHLNHHWFVYLENMHTHNLLLLHSYFFFVWYVHHVFVMENESSVVRLRRKLSELSREYSKEKQVQPRSKSANGRIPPSSDLNGSLRYRRMRRKVLSMNFLPSSIFIHSIHS